MRDENIQPQSRSRRGQFGEGGRESGRSGNSHSGLEGEPYGVSVAGRRQVELQSGPKVAGNGPGEKVRMGGIGGQVQAVAGEDGSR